MAVRHFRDRARPFDMPTEPQITARSLRRRGADRSPRDKSVSFKVLLNLVMWLDQWFHECTVLCCRTQTGDLGMQTSFAQPLQRTHEEIRSQDNLAVGSLK